MSAEQIATRIIAERTVHFREPHPPRRHTEAISEIKDVSVELQRLPFYVDETGGLSIAQLARAPETQAQEGLDVLYRLYQLLSARKASPTNPRAGGGDGDSPPVSRRGQGVEVPIIALIRALASGEKPRRTSAPALDLRESGSDRAGTPSVDVRVPRVNIDLANKEPRRARRAPQTGRRNGHRAARPSSSSASSVTAQTGTVQAAFEIAHHAVQRSRQGAVYAERMGD